MHTLKINKNQLLMSVCFVQLQKNTHIISLKKFICERLCHQFFSTYFSNCSLGISEVTLLQTYETITCYTMRKTKVSKTPTKWKKLLLTLWKKEIVPNIKFASPIARTVPVSEKTNKSEEDLSALPP